MLEQNSQKLAQGDSALLPEQGKQQALSQNTIYEILSRGVVYTMEEDLKEAQRLGSARVNLIPQQAKQEKLSVSLKDPFPEEEKIDIEKELAEKLKEKQIVAAFKPKPIEPPSPLPEKVNNERKAPEPPTSPEPPEPLKPPPPKEIPIIQAPPSKEFSFVFSTEEKNKIQQKAQTRKMEILGSLRKIPLDKKPLQEKRNELGKKILQEETLLNQFLDKDKILVQQFKAVEDQEAKALDFSQKHQFEQKRWEIEEKRRLTEEDKWAREEEIEKLHLTLGKIENDLRNIDKDEMGLQKEKEFCENMLEFLRLNEEKAFLETNLLKKTAGGQSLQEKRDLLLQKKQDLTQQVLVVGEEEKKIEFESKDLSQKEEAASNPQERRKWGQERWQAQEKRKIQEKKRWDLEKELSITEGGFVVVEKNYQQLKESQEKVDQGIANLIVKFNGDPLLKDYLPNSSSAKAIKTEKVVEKIAPDPKQEQEIMLQAKAKEEELLRNAVKRQAEQQKSKIDQSVQEEKDAQEKEKKLQQIRNQAEVEKTKQKKELKGPLVKEEILKRLTQISPKEEADRQAFLDRVAGNKILTLQKKKSFDQTVVFHPLIKRASKLKKFAVRLVLISVTGGMLAVGVWSIMGALKKPPEAPSAPIWPPSEENKIPVIIPTSTPTTTVVEPPPPEEFATTTPVIPEGLFEMDSLQTVVFQNPAEIGAFFVLELATQQAFQKLKRVVFVNNQEQKIVALEDILGTNGLGALMPDGFFQQITYGDIFLYGAKTGTRLGMVVKVNPGNALVLMMKNWEKSAFADLKQVFVKSNYAGAAIVTTFKVSKTTPPFKYLTVSNQDLGICYFITDKYFVLTTSFEAMEKTIEKITQTE